MRLPMLGVKLFLVLVCLPSNVGCRTSIPPPTDICIGDGYGGADCVLSDGTKRYLSPSALQNAWIIPTQQEAAAFVSWCYDTNALVIQRQLEALKKEARY